MITYREYCKTIKEDWGKTSPIPKETYKPVDWKNNFNWIDLGLPSGTLWADVNLYNPDNTDGFWTWDDIMASPYKDYVPAQEQYEELIDNCDLEPMKNSYDIRVIEENGNSVIFPAEGLRNLDGKNSADLCAYYWTSTRLNGDYSYFFESLGNYAYANSAHYAHRAFGMSVRLAKSL